MEDLIELLDLLKSHDVRYLVIGAHALGLHGHIRATKDIDLWVDRERQNAERLASVLREFGTEIGLAGVERFASDSNQMIRLGSPPTMVDILNFAAGPSFDEVWQGRIAGELWGVTVHYPSKTALIEMKRASGRPQDLLDVQKLSDDQDT